jgi:hypothetical protein
LEAILGKHVKTLLKITTKKSNKIKCPGGMAQVVECWGSMCKNMALGSVPRTTNKSQKKLL